MIGDSSGSMYLTQLLIIQVSALIWFFSRVLKSGSPERNFSRHSRHSRTVIFLLRGMSVIPSGWTSFSCPSIAHLSTFLLRLRPSTDWALLGNQLAHSVLPIALDLQELGCRSRGLPRLSLLLVGIRPLDDALSHHQANSV